MAEQLIGSERAQHRANTRFYTRRLRLILVRVANPEHPIICLIVQSMTFSRLFDVVYICKPYSILMSP